MSLDYRDRVLRDAIKLGIPCVLRVGKVVALCTAVHREIDGTHRGSTEAKVFPSAGLARQFVARAVAESGWKCAQRVELPRQEAS